jgi:hypothetical protein
VCLPKWILRDACISANLLAARRLDSIEELEIIPDHSKGSTSSGSGWLNACRILVMLHFASHGVYVDAPDILTNHSTVSAGLEAALPLPWVSLQAGGGGCKCAVAPESTGHTSRHSSDLPLRSWQGLRHRCRR